VRRLSRPVVDGDRLVGRHEVHAERRRDVEQHAPTQQAVGHGHDGVAQRAVALDLGRGNGVVHLAPHEHVAERIDVRQAQAVDLGADEIAARLVADHTARVAGIARRQHVVLGGERSLGRRRRREIMGQAERASLAHQRGGGDPVFGGLVVERAALIVGAPPAPVLAGLVDRVELGGTRLDP
jgi:hypothetical protein